MAMGTPFGSFSSPEIDRESDLLREIGRMKDALEWLTEMAGYAINHLEPEWAKKNRADLAHALEQANTVLSRP